MKTAMITITYNDDYKLEEWVEKFKSYKHQFDRHIIVDNGSNPIFKEKLKTNFPDCDIIFSPTNGGCTGAYNVGIKFAREMPEIEAVMLLANDFRLSKNCVQNLSTYLSSDQRLGMVAPVWVEENTLDVVADYGCEITSFLSMKPFGAGKKLSDISEDSRYCDAVGGGTNLATLDFYEQVGLQDEKLFMYSDEVDMSLRARKLGILMGVTKKAQVWHEHINPPNSNNDRPHYVRYLTGRNKIYVSSKHCGVGQQVYIAATYIFGSMAKLLLNVLLLRKNRAVSYSYMLMGAFMGVFKKMDPNRFSQPK